MSSLRSRYSTGRVGAPTDNKSLRSRRGIQRVGVPTDIKTLRSRRSSVVSDKPTPLQELPFEVFRGYEGVQICATWHVPPVGADEILLVKKKLDWSQNINDGVQLVNDKLPFTIFSYSDQELDPYECYYFSLFARRSSDSVWTISERYRAKEFALPTGYFEDRLWRSLPQVYHREDGE